MAVKCIQCGGPCTEIGNGEYECQFCGSTFSKEELAPVPVKQPAPAPIANNNDSGANVFEKNINGILEIACAGKKGSWSGSGYIISCNGYAITNAHVAADDVDGQPCQKIVVRVCGQTIPASVVALADDKAGHGSGIDLAIIKLAHLPAGVTPLAFESLSNIRNGEPVFVIGNSLGEGTCITSGIVSDKARNVNGKTFIMTDCAVNGGNSGGPIFDRKGLIIGTITLQGRAHDGGDAEGMNYAIPANVVQMFVEQVQRRFNIRF